MKPSSLLLVAGFATMFLASCAMTMGAYPPLNASQAKGAGSYTHVGAGTTVSSPEPGKEDVSLSKLAGTRVDRPKPAFVEPLRGLPTEQSTSQFTVPSTGTTPAITFSSEGISTTPGAGYTAP